MYENEKRCRDEEGRERLIHRMVRAEIRADRAQALFRQIRRWIESGKIALTASMSPWGKSWIIRPQGIMNILNLPAWSVLDTREADHDYHITVQLSYPPRRDGGAFPQAPPICGASALPRQINARIFRATKSLRVGGLGAVAILG